ncbi:MAG: hypothetical protein ABI891_00735 [Acidobacteriota bacterium]
MKISKIRVPFVKIKKFVHNDYVNPSLASKIDALVKMVFWIVREQGWLLVAEAAHFYWASETDLRYKTISEDNSIRRFF